MIYPRFISTPKPDKSPKENMFRFYCGRIKLRVAKFGKRG